MKLYFYAMANGDYDVKKREFKRFFTAREAEARETAKLYIAEDKDGFPFSSAPRLYKDKVNTDKVFGYGYLVYTEPSEAAAREAFRQDYLKRAEWKEEQARENLKSAEFLRALAASL